MSKRKGRKAKRRDNVMRLALARHHEAPTPERLRHDAATRADTMVEGIGARPYRMVDTLGCMRRHGTITAGQARAGRRFAREFAAAQLDPLRIGPLVRVSGRGGARLESDELRDRRDALGRILDIFGGHGAAGARAVWYVLGAGDSLAEWARRERFGHGRPLGEEAARGVLVCALAVLEAHYWPPDARGRGKTA